MQLDDKPIEYDIKEAIKYLRFQKTMEKRLDLIEWYFLILAQQGVKLPTDFDLNQLRNTSSDQGHPQQALTL